MTQVGGIAEWLREWAAAPDGALARVERLLTSMSAVNPADRIYTLILDQCARRRAQELRQQSAARQHHDRGAQVAGRALAGVPVAIKDNIEIAGYATSCGSVALAQSAATRDAVVVDALNAMGAIIIGKTNMDEAALGASGRNEHFGHCTNPRDRQLLSGGSSSGSAAAVAAGHASLAIGTDSLGSVRIPAALCRVVGFKPTHGLLSGSGVVPVYPPFDSVGLLTGSIADAAYVVQALCAEQRAPAAPPARAVRLLCLTDSHLALADASTAAAYRRCIDALGNAAAIERLWFPAFDFMAVSRAALWEVASAFTRSIAPHRQLGALLPQLGVELTQVLVRAQSMSEERLGAGRRELDSAAAALRVALMDADALLTPTCPVDSVHSRDALPKAISAFVAPANIAGLPAVSWPQTLSGNRHISLQLIGRAGEDLQLLQVAQQIREALAD
jgi:aspartyl-tRNA(Asn)/glutamyl-tRNA(Gln) amidotransferase subunit A